MKTKALAALVTLTLTVAGAVALTYSLRHEGLASVAESTLSSQPTPVHHPPKAAPPVSKLINSKKVSALFVKHELGRAFSISRSGPMRPRGDALTQAKRLLPAAEAGDATAAYDIFLTTLDCANNLRNSGKMYQEVGPTSAKLSPVNDLSEDGRKLLECEGLLVDKDFQEKNWLDMAAKNGSIEAMLMYPINPDHILGSPRDYAMKPELVQQWKDDSLTYLNRAASLGSTDALYSLSDVYEKGIISPADPVEAYAYHLAALKVTNAPSSPRAESNFTNKLTTEQSREAQSRSELIIKSCCI